MDRRSTPFSGRIAARRLEGQVEAEAHVEPRRVALRGNGFLHAAPGGARDRQTLTGDLAGLIETREGWAFVEAEKDGYCGWIDAALVVEPDPGPPTHRVIARTTWLQPRPEVRPPAVCDLHLGSKVRMLADEGKWMRVTVAGHEGYLPRGHLMAVGRFESDPVAVAERFLGTPYVWAGNTGFGIDCSGLAQASLLACGIACPGDSDQQERALGRELGPDEELRRGDLLFWKGHVALVADETRMIHANGASMDTRYEPLETGIARIAAQGDPVTSRRRL